MGTLVDIGCTDVVLGLVKLLWPESLNHPASFAVLSVVSVLKKSLIRVVSQSLRVLSQSLRAN